MNTMNTLKIDDEFKNLLPPLTEEEYAELERDIKKHGVLSPIITWDGYIIDGHNRYDICQKNDIELPATKSLEFENRSDVLKWIIDNQSGRRNLTKSQLIKANVHVEEQLRKEAKERQIAGGGDKRSEEARTVEANLPQPISKKRNPQTSDIIAKRLGMSRKTYEASKVVVNEGSKEQIDRLDKGGKGNGAERIASEIKEKKAQEGVPEGYKRCSKCGEIKPLSEFNADRSSKDGRKRYCKKCHCADAAERRSRDVFGNRIGVSEEFRSLRAEDIIGNLYEAKEVTFDDAVEECSEASNSWVNSVTRICDANAENLQSEENKSKMLDVLEEFEKEIKRIKEKINGYKQRD